MKAFSGVLLGCLALTGCGNSTEERQRLEIGRLEAAIKELREAQRPENRPLSLADTEFRTMLMLLHKDSLTHIESDRLAELMEKERRRYAKGDLGTEKKTEDKPEEKSGEK